LLQNRHSRKNGRNIVGHPMETGMNGTEPIQAFHKYRITYHNNMHLMMQNASAYLWGEAWRSANMSDSDKEKYAKDSNAYLKESYGYQLSTHLVEQVIKNHCKVDLMDVDSLEIRLKLKEPFLTEGKEKLAVESYFFPIHILDK